MGSNWTPNDPSKPTLAELLADGSPLLSLAQSFRDDGHELYLVGGPVRDALLRREPGDLDLSTDATPAQIKQLIGDVATEVWLQGERFGTVGARIAGTAVEITTFRTERYQPASRHPEVSFTANVTTDLSRRDFTVNAMALRLPERESLDPFDGVGDLKRKLLRTPISPHDSFTDDPLRMLRAFRFAAQLEFQIADEVLAAITELKNELSTVSEERIRDELSKLVTGARPAAALKLADGTGITDLFLPELSALKLEQDPVQKHKDVFIHTLVVLERTEPKLELRLAALLHDIGKPKTRRITREKVSFHHHEVVGAKMAEHRLRSLRYPNEMVTTVRDLIALHHRFHTYRLGWTDSAVRRYVKDAGPLLETLNELVRADCTTRNPNKVKELSARMDELQERIAELAEREELSRIRPEIDGAVVMEHLGLAPGPQVGEALAFLLEVRLDEGEIGRDEVLKRLDEWARTKGITS